MTIVVRLFGFLAELQSALCSYGTQGWQRLLRTGGQEQETKHSHFPLGPGRSNQVLFAGLGTQLWILSPESFPYNIQNVVIVLVRGSLDGVHRVLQDGLSFPAGLYLHPQDTKQEAWLQGNRIN